MLHFANAEVVQERSPLLVFFEILGDMLREENVSGIPAIHHPLRRVKTSTGKIWTIIHVHHSAHWSAVNSHAQLEMRMLLERAADLYRALRGRFRTCVKHQSHPIAGRNLKQAVRSFGALQLFRGANNLAQFFDCRVLLVNRKLRITDNVDEEDMSNLKLDLFPDLSGHFFALSGRPKLFFSTVLYLRF